MAQPTHARIGFYTARPGDLDAVIERARDEVIPMLESESGFRRYTLVRTGADTLASITGWDTHAQAAVAAQRLSAWVAQVMGETLVSVENHLATVASIAEASHAVPTYGRVTVWQFKPGMRDVVRARLEAEYVPVLREQPGFIRYVIFETGAESAITFTGFALKEEPNAAMVAARTLVDSIAETAIVSLVRSDGPVLWAIRKD